MADQVEVKFGASTGELTSGVDIVKNKISEIAGVVAGAFTVSAIVAFGEEIAHKAEQIERLHNLTGLSTDSIQTMQYAMKYFGGDAEAAGMMLSRFERNLDQAASGSGPAYAAFQKLGISLDELKHSPVQQIFDDMLNGFKNITDESKRANVGNALFGRSWANIVSILQGGKPAFDDMKEKLKETGNYMSDEMVVQVSNLGKDLVDLGEAFKGTGLAIVEYFVKPLQTAVEWMTKLVESIGGGKSLIQQLQDEEDARTGKKGVYSAPIGPEKPKPGADKIDRTGLGTDKSDQSSINQAYAMDRQLYAEDYNVQKEQDELKVANRKMTFDQMTKALQEALIKEQSLSDASFDDQLAGYEGDEAGYQRLLAQKTISDQKYQIAHDKLTLAMTKNDNKTWDSAFKTIESSFDQMLKGVLQGTQTIGQAFQKLGQNLVVAMLESFAKTEMEWAKTQLQMLYASITADQAKVASKTAATAEGDAIDSASHSSEIMKDAAGAAAGAYNALAGIPIIGPFIAPIAAGVAFGAVAAFDSFDVGTPYVPSDRLAMVHQGEAIIPQKSAQAWRDGDLGGGDTHVHFNVSAMDAGGVQAFMKKNGGAIAKALVSASRGGSNALSHAMART